MRTAIIIIFGLTGIICGITFLAMPDVWVAYKLLFGFFWCGRIVKNAGRRGGSHDYS